MPWTFAVREEQVVARSGSSADRAVCQRPDCRSNFRRTSTSADAMLSSLFAPRSTFGHVWVLSEPADPSKGST